MGAAFLETVVPEDASEDVPDVFEFEERADKGFGNWPGKRRERDRLLRSNSRSSADTGRESFARLWCRRVADVTDRCVAELTLRVLNLLEIRRVLRDRFSDEFVLKPSDVKAKSADVEFLEKVRAVIETHIGDGNFGVEWPASEVGISSRQLQRRLRKSIGLSAAGFIRTKRLERSARLLSRHAGTVSEIVSQVGFMDARYFSRLFRQTFGMTPSEYERAGDGEG